MDSMRFGDVAVALGYVSRQQVEAAAAIQRLEHMRNSPHRLIGQILVERGCITHRQVTEVLTCLVGYAVANRALHTETGRVA